MYHGGAAQSLPVFSPPSGSNAATRAATCTCRFSGGYNRFSAYHSSVGFVGPYRNDVGPRKKTSRVALPEDAWIAPRHASKSAPLTVVPATTPSSAHSASETC